MKIYQMPPKKSVSATTSTAPVTTPVPAPVPEPAPVAAAEEQAAPVVVEEVSSSAKFTSLLEKLQSFSTDLKELIATVKTLQKEHVKLQKITTKKSKKQSPGGGARTLSRFAKPSLLSDELCEFMGVTKGTLMARTEVTRSINEYIKKNSLQDSNDKRHIVADDKLKKILNLGADDKLTYFNLQKYMKHHFTKQA